MLIDGRCAHRPRYFVTDLDGTLLRSDASVSDLTVEVVTRALHAGQVVSFATARSWISAKTQVHRIPWQHPIIVYNGAIILDPVTEDTLWGRFLDRDVAANILALGDTLDLVPLIFGRDATGRDCVWNASPLPHGPSHFKESRPHDPRFEARDPLRILPGDQVLMLTYIAEESQVAALQDRARETFAGYVHIHVTRDTYLHDYWFLELSHPDANKAAALQAWASLVGCDAGMVTVFGDNLNDLGLFAAGGHRIAVKNAHRELKSRADEVIASNDDDAVAHYLARHL